MARRTERGGRSKREDVADGVRGSDGARVLLAKYQQLTTKYAALAKRLQGRSRKTLDFYGLAGWALQSSSVGCALVRDGQILVTNPAFQRMTRSQRGQIWRAVAWPGQTGVVEDERTFSSVRELVREEGGRLEAAGARRGRYADGGRVLEISFEQAQNAVGSSAVLVHVRDVTAVVALEVELARSQEVLLKHEPMRLIGELGLGIAHDLNNLLGALDLRVRVLASDPVCQAAQAENLGALNRIIREGTTLVSKLRTFGIPTDERQASVDLCTVLDEAIEIASSGLQLALDSHPGSHLRIERAYRDLPPVKASAHELRHVFVNLLTNARDAMPNGGTVRISGARTRRSVVLRFEDDGPGIPEPALARVFDRAYSTKGLVGSGLGLAMAKKVMESVHGSINAYNQPTGGAGFELIFPVLADRPPAGKAAALAPSV